MRLDRGRQLCSAIFNCFWVVPSPTAHVALTLLLVLVIMPAETLAQIGFNSSGPVPWLDVTTFGAKGDAKQNLTAGMTSVGTATLALQDSTANGFSLSDVGKAVSVNGAGVAAQTSNFSPATGPFTGGVLACGTVYWQITWISENLSTGALTSESVPGPEGSQALTSCSANNGKITLTMPSMTLPTGATGWVPYFGYSSGAELAQVFLGNTGGCSALSPGKRGMIMLIANSRMRTLFKAMLWVALCVIATQVAPCQDGVPWIASPLVPTSVAPGSTPVNITVNGVGFSPDAVIDWNGASLPTTFTSSGQLTATLASSDVSSPQTAMITVVNPGGTSEASPFFVSNSSNTLATFRTDFAVGLKPSNLAAGDWNHDGRPDVALTSPLGLSILLGNGDGTFQASIAYSYGAGEQPTNIIAADFNGDGSLDLAFILAAAPSQVAVSLGNGDGTFQSPVSAAVGSSPTNMTAADLDGDGNLDLVTVDTFVGQISVFLGNGDGTFREFASYNVVANPDSVALGDFNHDSKLDVAVAGLGANNTKGISVLLGNGDGTFQDATLYPSGASSPNSIVSGDLNRDGNTDLVSATGAGVVVLLGKGDGTFGATTTYGAGAFPDGATLMDLNSDNILDVIVSNPASNAINILVGNGDGSFQKAIQFKTGTSPQPSAIGDFNGDGLPDIIVPDVNDGTLSLLMQTRDAVATLSAASLSFGTQPVERTGAIQTATLTNTGSSNLAISGITVTDTDFLMSHTCPPSLAPQSQCKINVAFKPLRKGLLTGQVQISDNAMNSPQAIALSGTGTFALISPTSINFGVVGVGQSSTQTTTLTNLGTTSMTINNIYTSGPPYTETNTCGSTLASKARCVISVTFSPTRTGTKAGTLYIGDSGGGSPQQVALAGTGQ